MKTLRHPHRHACRNHSRHERKKDVEQVAGFIARALALYVGDQVCPNPDGFSQLKGRSFRV